MASSLAYRTSQAVLACYMLGASLPNFFELTMALCVESDLAGGFIQSMRDPHASRNHVNDIRPYFTFKTLLRWEAAIDYAASALAILVGP
jgi:hypothetical protein